MWEDIGFSALPPEGLHRMRVTGFGRWDSKETQKCGVKVCLRLVPDDYGREIAVMENELISRDGMFVAVLVAVRDGKAIDFENERLDALTFEATGKELYGLIVHRTSKGKIFPQIKQALSVREFNEQQGGQSTVANVGATESPNDKAPTSEVDKFHE